MSHVSAEEAVQIYPAKYFSASSTYDHWCKLSIADVHRLKHVQGFEGQNIRFCLNHPIRFVYIVALVVGINEIYPREENAKQQLVILTLDDGSGACIEAKFVRYKHDPIDAITFSTNVSNLTVEAGIGRFMILLEGRPLEVGAVIKAKGTLTSFRNETQLDLKRVATVKDTEEEVAGWRAAAVFKQNILVVPWCLDEGQQREIDQGIAREATRQRKLDAHEMEKRSRRARKRSEREMHEEKKRRALELEMNKGALF